MLYVLHSPLGVGLACFLAEGCDDEGVHDVRVVVAGGVSVGLFFTILLPWRPSRVLCVFLSSWTVGQMKSGNGEEGSRRLGGSVSSCSCLTRVAACSAGDTEKLNVLTLLAAVAAPAAAALVMRVIVEEEKELLVAGMKR